MRVGWKEYTLSSVTKYITDGSHNPPKGVPNSEYLMLSSKNVLDDNLHYDAPRYLSKEQFANEDKRTRIEPGDVLLTIVGTIGRCAVVPEGAPRITLQRSVAVIRSHSDAIVPRFLMYSFLARTEELNSLSRGVAQKGIYLETLRDLRVAIPPLPEQRRIVGLLGEAFGGAAAAKANAEKNLQNAQTVFGSVFSAWTKNEEQGKWPQTTVAKIAEEKKGSIRTGPFGSQLLHSEFVDDGIAVLGIDNAVANEFRWGKYRYITNAKYESLKRYRVYPGDVIITIMGTCGRCAVIPQDIQIAINSKHLCCITLDRTQCLPEYLHAYFLHHPLSLEFLAKRAKGSIMAGLNMGIIQELPVLLPPVEKQRELIWKLQIANSETQRLSAIYQQKLDALDALKKSLLYQAFSGQL